MKPKTETQTLLFWEPFRNTPGAIQHSYTVSCSLTRCDRGIQILVCFKLFLWVKSLDMPHKQAFLIVFSLNITARSIHWELTVLLFFSKLNLVGGAGNQISLVIWINLSRWRKYKVLESWGGAETVLNQVEAFYSVMWISSLYLRILSK